MVLFNFPFFFCFFFFSFVYVRIKWLTFENCLKAKKLMSSQNACYQSNVFKTFEKYLGYLSTQVALLVENCSLYPSGKKTETHTQQSDNIKHTFPHLDSIIHYQFDLLISLFFPSVNSISNEKKSNINRRLNRIYANIFKYTQAIRLNIILCFVCALAPKHSAFVHRNGPKSNNNKMARMIF